MPKNHFYIKAGRIPSSRSVAVALFWSICVCLVISCSAFASERSSTLQNLDVQSAVSHENTSGYPHASPDRIYIIANTPTSVPVLANDSDPENDPLSITRIIEPPAKGNAQITAAQQLLYTPNPEFVGLDHLSYEISDSSGLTASTSATIDVIQTTSVFNTLNTDADSFHRCCQLLDLHMQPDNIATGSPDVTDWFFLDLTRAKENGLQATLANFETDNDQLVVSVTEPPRFTGNLAELEGETLQAATTPDVQVNPIAGESFLNLGLDTDGKLIALRFLDIDSPETIPVRVDTQINLLDLSSAASSQPLAALNYQIVVNNISETPANALDIRFSMPAGQLEFVSIDCGDTSPSITTQTASELVFQLPSVPAATVESWGVTSCTLQTQVKSGACVSGEAVQTQATLQPDIANAPQAASTTSLDCAPLELSLTLEDLLALLEHRNEAVGDDTVQYDRNRDGYIDIADARLVAIALSAPASAQVNQALAEYNLKITPQGLQNLGNTDHSAGTTRASQANPSSTQGGSGAAGPMLLLIFGLLLILARLRQNPKRYCCLCSPGNHLAAGLLILLATPAPAIELVVQPSSTNVAPDSEVRFDVKLSGLGSQTVGAYDLGTSLNGPLNFQTLTFSDSLNASDFASGLRDFSLDSDSNRLNVFEVSQLSPEALATLQADTDELTLFTIETIAGDAGEVGISLHEDALVLADGNGDHLTVETTAGSSVRISSLTSGQRDFADTIARNCQDPTDPAVIQTCQALEELDPLTQEQVIQEAYPAQISAHTNSGVNGSRAQAANLLTRMANIRAGSTGIDLSNLTPQGQLPHLADSGDDFHSARRLGGGASADADTGQFEKWGLFLNGSVNFGKQDPTTQESGYDYTSQAITLGTDYRFGTNVVAGLALGLTFNDNDFVSNAGSMESFSYDFSGYTTWYPSESWYVDMLAGFGRTNYDLERRIQGAGDLSPTTATSDTQGNQWQIGVSSGYTFQHNAFSATPHARFGYRRVGVDGYTEQGDNSTFLIKLGDQHLESLRTALGLQTTYALSSRFGVFLPTLDLEWIHEYQDESQAIQVQSLLDNTATGRFALTTDNPDRDFFTAGFGISAQFAKSRSAFLFYERLFGWQSFSRNIITAGVRLAF